MLNGSRSGDFGGGGGVSSAKTLITPAFESKPKEDNKNKQKWDQIAFYDSKATTSSVKFGKVYLIAHLAQQNL